MNLQELFETKKASVVSFDDLFAALKKHAFQVTFSNMKSDGENSVTMKWKNPEGKGTVRMTARSDGVYVVPTSGMISLSLGTFPYQSASSMAEAIDEALASFAHDLDDLK